MEVGQSKNLMKVGYNWKYFLLRSFYTCQLVNSHSYFVWPKKFNRKLYNNYQLGYNKKNQNENVEKLFEGTY